MRMRGLGLVALVSLLVLSASGSAGAAPSGARGKADADVAFWTHARVARAVSRDYVYDPASGRFVPGERAKPAPGGGGGGTTPSTSTTGSSWPTGATLVRTATGKVLFEMAGTYYVCSASTVAATAGDLGDDKSVVVTAGHCVYDNESATKDYAHHWVFIPDYDDGPAPLSTSTASYCNDTKFGCWAASSLHADANFRNANGFSGLALPYDFGLVRLDTGGFIGETKDAERTVGAQGIAFGSLASRTQVSAFGYPAAGKYHGSDLVYCAGKTGTDTSTGSYSLACDMTGGSSGGPWLSDFDGSKGTVSSVNSYGYSGVRNMYGPQFNGATSTLYSAANA